jgi:hypothetical protein
MRFFNHWRSLEAIWYYCQRLVDKETSLTEGECRRLGAPLVIQIWAIRDRTRQAASAMINGIVGASQGGSFDVENAVLQEWATSLANIAKIEATFKTSS